MGRDGEKQEIYVKRKEQHKAEEESERNRKWFVIVLLISLNLRVLRVEPDHDDICCVLTAFHQLYLSNHLIMHAL